MHAIWPWLQRAAVALEKVHFRVRHFGGVFALPVVKQAALRVLCVSVYTVHFNVTQFLRKLRILEVQKPEFFLASRGGRCARRLRASDSTQLKYQKSIFPDLTCFCYHLFDFRVRVRYRRRSRLRGYDRPAEHHSHRHRSAQAWHGIRFI